jgi:hypothetical protein
MFESADLIHRYPRADVLRDGVLIDVSATAREAGFKFWDEYLKKRVGLEFGIEQRQAHNLVLCAQVRGKMPDASCSALHLDEGNGREPGDAGRLWDVLTMLRLAVHGQGEGAREVRFGVHVRNEKRERTPPLVRLKALCGPGDQGEAVVTVMLPDEDYTGAIRFPPISNTGQAACDHVQLLTEWAELH